MKRYLAAWLAVFGGGWLVGHAIPRARAATPAAVASARDFNLCSGGTKSALGVEIVPEAVEQGARGESLRLRVHLTSRFESAAAVRHAVELVDDRGQAVMAPRTSPIGRLGRAGDESVSVLRTPDGLADGYYQIRVTAVGSDRAKDAAELVSAYLKVEHGAISQIDSDEWFAHSHANAGVSL